MHKLVCFPILFACCTLATAQTLQDNFKRNVSTLASEAFEGREASTPADTLSARYIAQEFAQIPGIVMLGDSGIQQVSYEHRKTMLTAEMSLVRSKLTLKKDFLPAMASDAGRFEGKTLFLGYGTKDDYAEKEVTNQFVLVNDGAAKGEDALALYDKARLAIEAGAAGLLVIEDASEVSDKEATRLTLGKGDEAHFLLAKVNKQTGAKLKAGNAFKASVEFHTPIKHTHNVVARVNALKEHNPTGRTIIIGAHYDHMGYKMEHGKKIICWGADDNASGVATIIELAKKYTNKREELKRDIIFIAFGAEEKGLKGSAYYAEHPLDSLSNCVAMVNFDMTGRMVNKGITIRGLGAAHQAISLFSLLPNPDELDIVWEMRGAGPTDYSSFYRKGIPAFSFSTRIHGDYHTPRDTEEKVNYEGMEMMFNYVSNLINKLAIETVELTVKHDKR